MELFEAANAELDAFLLEKSREKTASIFNREEKPAWPSTPDRNLVLAQDTAVELGRPEDFSTAGLFWTSGSDKTRHGRITLLGPDIPALKDRKIPFGKMVRAVVTGGNPENQYRRYLEMELVRFGLRLEGYMMRGVSQHQREWVRISREALAGGFSFKILGGALIDALMQLDYVKAAEVVFVTSGRNDVSELHRITQKAGRIVAAMEKLSENHIPDCDVCEYQDVCQTIDRMKRNNA